MSYAATAAVATTTTPGPSNEQQQQQERPWIQKWPDIALILPNTGSMGRDMVIAFFPENISSLIGILFYLFIFAVNNFVLYHYILFLNSWPTNETF